jgi:hypothetical protein
MPVMTNCKQDTLVQDLIRSAFNVTILLLAFSASRDQLALIGEGQSLESLYEAPPFAALNGLFCTALRYISLSYLSSSLTCENTIMDDYPPLTPSIYSQMSNSNNNG